MIAIVTTATSTVTTGTPGMVARASGSTDDLALVAVLLFMVLVMQKESVSPGSTERERNLARGLNIGIVPLSLAFSTIALNRLLQMLL